MKGPAAGPEWAENFPGAITVCDREGRILYMNDAAGEVFRADGGRELIGRNLFDCHPEPSRSKLRGLLDSGGSNVYTIEKGGARKLIFQAPWTRDGTPAGLVEISLRLPAEMPHFVREG